MGAFDPVGDLEEGSEPAQLKLLPMGSIHLWDLYETGPAPVSIFYDGMGKYAPAKAVETPRLIGIKVTYTGGRRLQMQCFPHTPFQDASQRSNPCWT